MVPTSAGVPLPSPRCCPGLHQGDQGFNEAICSGSGWSLTGSSCRHGGIAQDPRRSAAYVSPCAAAQTAGTRRYPHLRAASSAWGSQEGTSNAKALHARSSGSEWRVNPSEPHHNRRWLK